jgi:hypothetical protein
MTCVAVKEPQVAETGVVRIGLVEYVVIAAASACHGEAFVRWHGDSNAA